MRILVLEASTSQGSVIVWQDGSILFSESFSQPRGRGEALLKALGDVVEACGRTNQIIVGVGPGSYNGIRAAIAAAEGLKLVWKVPTQGICSLLGVPSESKRYAVAGDARGGCFFFATICEGQLGEIRLLSQKEFEHCLEAWEEPVYASAAIPAFPHLVVRVPAAKCLANLVAEYPGLAIRLRPLYLKQPHITQPAAKNRMPRTA